MRYRLLDEIRGATMVSMIIYHACWDLIYLFGMPGAWYESPGAYLWQQSICWTFIFLSGFCWHFGRKKLRRGLKIFLGGALITAVTLAVMPEDRVVFGVLTFLGSAALMLIPSDRFLKKCPAAPGCVLSLLLFFLAKGVPAGYLGTGFLQLGSLPAGLYRNLFTTFLGFPHPGFFSTDYFSIFPWIFLYLAGYYSYMWMEQKEKLSVFDRSICPPLGLMGRYSFWIYMAHQPVLYGVFSVLAMIRG